MDIEERNHSGKEDTGEDAIYKETFFVDLYELRGLSEKVHGLSLPTETPNRYRIGLSEKATETRKLATFLHEITHIYNHDHDTGGNVNEIETRTRRQLLDALELLKQEGQKREPTEENEEARSAATIRKAPSPVTVGTLAHLEADIYDAYGVDSKPAGLEWVNMVLDLAKNITNKPGLLDAITEADLDQLTEDNFHTARHAAEVAQYLRKYTI